MKKMVFGWLLCAVLLCGCGSDAQRTVPTAAKPTMTSRAAPTATAIPTPMPTEAPTPTATTPPAATPKATATAKPKATQKPQTAVPTATPRSDTQTATVYVTENGKKYHRGSCRYLYQSKIPISLEKAKARYSPCSVCKP